VACLAVVALVAAGTSNGYGSLRAAPVFGYQVVASWPHDPEAYTEGLVIEGGFLYESTGLNGYSSLRKVVLRSGQVVQSVPLANRYFGEGLTSFRGRLYQLTWLQHTAFVYDLRTLRRLATVPFRGEGWGLTHDATSLIVSDGTPTLRFLDPRTLAVRKTLTVQDGDGGPVTSLNELEMVGGSICANLLGSDRIACIDPGSGRVRYWIDLTGVLPARLRPGDEEAVLNGIAYAGHPGRLLVTGKLWPRLLEIRVLPAA
jgi:glutamine cyclotransferase